VTEVELRVAGGLEILAGLERLGAATEISLDLPADMTYERYEALGAALGRAHRTVAWMLADWINFGERAYGEKYAQAVEVTNLRPETLMNYASVARKVPRERRRVELPFGVHAEVASLEPSEQVEWLEKAVVNEWKREDLREHLRPLKQLEHHAGVSVDLEDAARDLVRSAKKYGNDFLVQRPSFVQLCAALGEEV
jgi:hypothetical protein